MVAVGLTGFLETRGLAVKEIAFEAALYHSGGCYVLDAEGQAKLVLQIPASAAVPLGLAMAEGLLTERTFIVRIELA